MSGHAPEDLLRLCFPNFRAVGTGVHSRSISTSNISVEQLAARSQQQLNCYMTVSDYDRIKGARRKQFPNPRGYFLVLDFDLKHQEIYTEKAILLNELKKLFSTATAIVHSGGGFHVYYCSNEPIRHPDQDLVRTWFGKIRNWLSHSGLQLDRRAGLAITDVIRLPGSYHDKHLVHGSVEEFDATQVYTAKQLDDIVKGLCSSAKPENENDPTAGVESAEASPAVEQLRQVQDEQDIEHRVLWAQPAQSTRPTKVQGRTNMQLSIWQPMPLEDLRTGCRALDAFLVSSEQGFENGARGDRDDVLMACVTLHHTEVPDKSSRAYVGEVLARWPGGSEDYAHEQYDTIIESHGSAPWQCHKWSEHYSGECSNCPHNKTPGFSPYRAAKEKLLQRLSQQNHYIAGDVVQKIANVPDFGGLYFVGKDGALWAKNAKKDKDGVEIPDYRPVLRPACSVKFCRFSEEGFVVGVELSNLSGTTVTVPHSGINESRGRSEYFSKLGIHVIDHTLAGQFLQRCTEFATRRMQYEQFGWHGGHSGGVSFVGPGYVVTPDETKPCVLSDSCLNAIDGKPQDVSGQMDNWLNAVSIYKRSSQLPYQYFILSSFASVLYELLPNTSGAAITLVGESGAGKSTAMFAANSVWFKPDATTVTAIDTELGRYGALAVMNNMPVTLNEISHIDPEILFRMVFALTEGQGRRGMSQESKLQARQTWKTALLLTGNKGLMETVGRAAQGNRAAANRAIDIGAPDPKPEWAAQADAAMGILKSNYGVAGLGFVQQIQRLGVHTLRQTWLSYKARIDVDHPNVDRFVRVHSSLVLTTCHLLSSLGWDSFFNQNEMHLFINEHLKASYGAVARATIEGTITPSDAIQNRLNRLIPADLLDIEQWDKQLAMEDKTRVHSVISEQVWVDNDHYYLSRDYLMHYLRLHPSRELSSVIESWATQGWLVTHGLDKRRAIQKDLFVYGTDGGGGAVPVTVLVVPRLVVDPPVAKDEEKEDG